jgi:hypothetical protein
MKIISPERAMNLAPRPLWDAGEDDFRHAGLVTILLLGERSNG